MQLNGIGIRLAVLALSPGRHSMYARFLNSALSSLCFGIVFSLRIIKYRACREIFPCLIACPAFRPDWTSLQTPLLCNFGFFLLTVPNSAFCDSLNANLWFASVWMVKFLYSYGRKDATRIVVGLMLFSVLNVKNEYYLWENELNPFGLSTLLQLWPSQIDKVRYMKVMCI